MQLKLKQKIVWLAVAATVIPISIIFFIITVQKGAVNIRTDEELDKLTRDNIKQIARDVYGLCETSNNLLQKKVDYDLRVAHEILNLYGDIKLSQEKVKWRAVNQYTKENTPVEIPKMMVGGSWLGQNQRFHQRTHVVDDVYDLVGGTCTIFQRMNDEGDMLRVATTVQKLDNTRAIGTFIPAINPDGIPNPVISKILRGEDFYGRAYVVNAWYLTAYSPIKNEEGTIIGIIYVGVKQEAVESLRKVIIDTKVGKTGYVHILGATKVEGVNEGDKGQYIISKNGEQDGKYVWDAKTPDDRYIHQAIIENALKLKNNEVAYERYLWKNPGESEARMKLVAYTYFQPWDWVICAGTYEDDYNVFKERVSGALKHMLLWTLLTGLLLMGLALCTALILGGKIANPIVNITNIAKKVAEGDLDQEINVTSKDEVGELASTFRGMQLALKDLIENLDKKVADRTMKLQKAMKMAEEASQAKSDFIANTSHELRTPLNGIIGFAELMMASDSPEKHREYSELIIAESEALLTLINEVLDHAKIEAGKLTLEKHPFELQQVMQVIISGMALRARNKGLDFELDIARDIPRYLIGDANRLRQILVNLIGNALKFTEEGSISVRVASVEKIKDHCKLRFSIKDTGVGIPPEKQKTIFESFTQGDTSTTRKYGGTGLGTTISKRLVELMHGEIGLSSEVGKGSTFWFTALLENCHEEIPEEATDEKEPAYDPGVGKQTGHILVVEDYATNQEIVKSHLQSAGYTFDLAVNGKEALELTRRKKFDLILMDVQMPIMDGHEATRRIRTEETPNTRIPIIATTANAYKQDLERSLEAGMNDVVTKPLRKKSFLNVVAKWLSQTEDQQIQECDSTPPPPAKSESAPPPAEPENAAKPSPLNFDDFIENMGIEKQLAFQIIDVFLDDTRKQLSSLMVYIERQDREMLQREMHSIKGGAANIRAMQLQSVANNLEKLAEEGNLEEARRLVPELEEEFQHVVAHVQTLKS